MAGFNDVLSELAKSFGDVAKNISSGQTFRNIIPTKESFAQEVVNGINSNRKAKVPLVQDSINKAITRDIDDYLSPNPNIEQISKDISNALHKTSYSKEDMKIVTEILKKHNVQDEYIEPIAEGLFEDIDDIFKRAYIDATQVVISKANLTNPKMLRTYAKTYFNNPDPKIKGQRITAVTGTCMVVITLSLCRKYHTDT